MLTETRALGFVQPWTYWPWVSVETHTDADGLVRSFEYDARQRLTKETDPAGAITTHGYDHADHRTRTTRPGAAEWTYALDADGKLIDVESPEGHRTVYEHDKHGNRTVQRNAAGIVTRFDYDARHRVTAIDHPIGGDESFAYNGEGELRVHTDRAGQRIEIERDGLGRITERRYTAARSGDIHREVFALDGDGQPTTLSQYGAADGPQHVQRRYDGQGRLIEEDDRFNQRSTWTYDEVGNRLSVTDPAGTTTTAPDRLNRIARQTTAAGSTELSYSSAGRLQQITHPNGARSETRYDAAGRIERITHHQGSSEVARFEYTYDARGNRERETRIDASSTQRTEYRYDQDDRLTGTTVTAPGGSVTETTYTLDDVGNRAREVVRRNGATVSDIAYTYQAYQRLTETRDSVSGVLTEYAYDDRGHLISETRNGQTTTYRPNAQDRLATLTLPGAPPVQYAYDSEGKRVERRTPTELTRFGWDGETLRRETNAANNVIEAHDWAAGRILSSRRLNDTRYAQHDALRSPIRWSQSTGAEQGQLRYDAWGETTETNPDLPRIAYTGHYREREGSSYYAQQRYYRPGLGRFNRVDPWEGDTARPITLNKYLYANGNPLLYFDPDGRIALLLEWQAWAAQAGEDSLAYAESFKGASAEASWYAKPGLTIGWTLSGAAYLTAGATEYVISGANLGANAVVIGTEWAGEQFGTRTLMAPLAAEGRAEVDQMVESIGPSLDALRANPGQFIVAESVASAENIGGSINAALAGDSRALFDLGANLVRRGGGSTERRMTQQAQPVTVVEGGAASTASYQVARAHRPGNQQVITPNAGRWHVPAGIDPRTLPSEDLVGDRLQAIARDAASRWSDAELSQAERQAIELARRSGEHWQAVRLERQARGRWVENEVRASAQTELPDLRWSRVGVDVVDPGTGRKYDILSGTEHNLDTHAKRMKDETFRMVDF